MPGVATQRLAGSGHVQDSLAIAGLLELFDVLEGRPPAAPPAATRTDEPVLSARQDCDVITFKR
jgi:hypothetical protein